MLVVFGFISQRWYAAVMAVSCAVTLTCDYFFPCYAGSFSVVGGVRTDQQEVIFVLHSIRFGRSYSVQQVSRCKCPG